MSDENQVITGVTTVDGVDLSKLTADQLMTMSEEEWKEFITVVKAAMAAKKAEAKAEFKSKVAKVAAFAKNYILPGLLYGAVAVILLKVFNKI